MRLRSLNFRQLDRLIFVTFRTYVMELCIWPSFVISGKTKKLGHMTAFLTLNDWYETT